VATDRNVLTDSSLDEIRPIAVGGGQAFHDGTAQVCDYRHDRVREPGAHAERKRVIYLIMFTLLRH